MHPILAHHQWSFLLHAIVIVSVRSYLLFCDIVGSKDILTIVPVFRSFITGVAGVHNEPSLGSLARLLENILFQFMYRTRWQTCALLSINAVLTSIPSTVRCDASMICLRNTSPQYPALAQWTCPGAHAPPSKPISPSFPTSLRGSSASLMPAL